jgi:hypothetical protein
LSIPLAEHQHADLGGTGPALRAAVTSARTATDEFVDWLEKLAPTKTGPSGVGKQNYTWYQQNVHFSSYNWDEEVVLLRRELDRAQASLRLEEHNNRNLASAGAGRRCRCVRQGWRMTVWISSSTSW